MLTRSSHSISYLLLAALIVALGYAWAQSQDAPEGTPAQTAPEGTLASMTVRFVNMEEVVKQYPYWREQFQELAALAQQSQEEIRNLEREVQRLRDLIQSGSMTEDAINEFARRGIELERRRTQLQNELQARTLDVSTDVYNTVLAQVDRYCDEHGVDLVYNVNERRIRVGDRTEFIQKVTLRSVVRYPSELDITNDIILALGGTPGDSSRPIIVEDPLPNGTVGQAYEHTVAIEGGTAPFSWSIHNGNLPPGITLNPETGTLTGTPTEAGTWAVTLRCQDSETRYEDYETSLVIDAAPAEEESQPPSEGGNPETPEQPETPEGD